jgi:type IV secretion system protein TrbL
MKFNVLTLTLNTFVAAFAGGYGRLSGIANGLLATLGAIDLALLGLWWALGGGERLTHVFKKILYLGFWIWAVRSFPELAKHFVDTLMAAGTMAGGGGNSNILFDPSAVAGHGLDATAPLAQKIQDLGSFDIADAIVLGISYLLIVLCFMVMAINCFLTVLEYYLIVALVGVFLPFALFPSTKFMAEKAIGAVVAIGMKLMTLAFVMAVVEPTLGKIHFASDEIAMNEVLAVLLVSGGCTFLAWHAPRFAAGLMAGAPNLSAGDIAQHAAVAAGAVGLAVRSFASPSPSASSASAQRPGSAPSSGMAGSASSLVSPSASKHTSPTGDASAAPRKSASSSLVRSLAPGGTSPEADANGVTDSPAS